MRASVTEIDKIRYYMEIVSYSEEASVFMPKGSGRKFEVQVTEHDSDQYQLVFRRKIPATEGVLVVRVFTLQFKANVSLRSSGKQRHYHTETPRALNVHDPRRAVRIPVAPHVTKIVVVRKVGAREDDEEKLIRAMIQDVSANGISFKLKAADTFFRENRRVGIAYNIFGINVDAEARIVGVHGNVVRCHVDEIDKTVQQLLNKKISSSFNRMMDKHYNEIKNLVEASKHLRTLEADKRASGELADKAELDPVIIQMVNPCIDATIDVAKSFAGLKLEQRETKLERICSAIYDISAEISFKGPHVNGNLFLCMKEPVALAVASQVFGSPQTQINDDVRDVAGELCNIILGNSKKNVAAEKHFRLSTPTIVVGKEHLVAVLSKYPVVRMIFDSTAGQIDLNLYMDEIADKHQDDTGAPSMQFEYDEKLINPVLKATEHIFHTFLMLETRKKGVQIREKLAPKFELSAILDAFAPGMRGKILLNVSNKLAYKIHHILIGDEKNVIDDEVKDALGEMVNLIAGNAKNEYAKMNLNYQLSTPYVIYGRNHIISNAGNTPFLSTVYWTNEGFFEICISFMAV